MCAACSPGSDHHAVTDVTAEPTAQPAEQPAGQPAGTVAGQGPARFAALRNRECRTYLGGGLLSMMADNVEHVITYWVLWQTFHSPALAGFQVISHWVPFLLFSVYFGELADRFDCRRVIQAAQGLFMIVSVLWGVLFLTGTLEIWNACVLLVIHGLAGTLWGPAEQLMLHDFVGDRDLPSAVRLNSTARSLGILAGPVVGSALLYGLGPETGILVNVLIYLPLTVFLMRTRVTGHSRDGEHRVHRQRVSAFGALRVLAEIRHDPVIVSMIALAGLASFFIGVALQSTMPIFADDFNAGDGVYGVLLFANGLGGVIGGLLLEVTNRIRPTLTVAVVATFVFGATTAAFAATESYVLAILLLVLGGAANLASMSIGQTLVQLAAPPGKRGQVIGLFGMSANGLRFGNGVTVSLLGGLLGIHWWLGLSSLAVCVGTVLVALYAWVALRRRRRTVVASEDEYSLRAG